MLRTIAVVIPVLDDWTSFAALIGRISDHFTGSGLTFHICVVDDGSMAPIDSNSTAVPKDSCIASLEVIRLAVNLGHQRAIAVGLCAIAGADGIDAVLVMDSDGQDQPTDIDALLAANRQNPMQIILAQRTKRSEPGFFRLGYCVYKLLFRVLTGERISFGNFCMMPWAVVGRLVRMPELWNNLAASIMRSRLPYLTVPTVRGSRLAGQSKMGLTSLIVHGLSALSVHIDKIFARFLLAAALIAGLAVFGIVVVGVIRIATDLAIPGWATTIVGDLLIILLQTLVIVIAASLTIMAGRSIRPIVPIVDFQPYVAHRQRFRFTRRAAAPAVLEPAFCQ
jgi:polyisoprenyl-phosphate glycosyltransferase